MNVFDQASVIVIEGKRHSGKTTAAKQLIAKEADGQYVDLKEHTNPITPTIGSCIILDDFQPSRRSVVKEYLTLAQKAVSRVIIVCQNYEDLGSVIEPQVDYVLRRVVKDHNVWDLNAHNTRTNESFIVNICSDSTSQE